MSSRQTTGNCRDDNEYLLVVEGKDDCNSVYQLAAHHSIEGSFGIWEGGNNEGALRKFGGSLLASSGRPQAIGIVLDCDGDEDSAKGALTSRWAEITHRLRGPGYEIPEEPDPNGTVLEGTGDPPRVGIWIMPNNADNGMLEDFLLSLVPKDAVVYTRDVVREAKAKGVGSYKTVHESKAVAHTYLAWQDEPGRPLGLGIKTRFFDADSVQARPFVEWLRRLFARPIPQVVDVVPRTAGE